MAAFQLDISYAQLAVFDSHLEKPFNDWGEKHVEQGFSWRPGSVSFGTLDSSGVVHLDIIGTDTLDVATSSAVRIISVPFAVPSHGEIEVASIHDGTKLLLPSGHHELIFEHGYTSGGAMWANLHFRKTETIPEPRILRADSELTPPTEFLMDAIPG